MDRFDSILRRKLLRLIVINSPRLNLNLCPLGATMSCWTTTRGKLFNQLPPLDVRLLITCGTNVGRYFPAIHVAYFSLDEHLV